MYVTSEDCDVSESLLSGEQDFTVRQERGPHSETGRVTLHSCGMPSGDMPSPLGSAAGLRPKTEILKSWQSLGQPVCNPRRGC